MRPYLLPIVFLLFSTSATSSPPSAQETELFDGLLGWAVKLSGYRKPSTHPTVEFVPQAFFDANACRGKRCRVWGWYPNTGGNVVYVHEAARALIEDGSDPRSLLAASIVVHEFTHYLQAANRDFAKYGCTQALELEREAYNVQNAYIVAYGRYMQVGISLHNTGCGEWVGESETHAGVAAQ
ncbi:MAG TPA: hypothetical protein VGL25_01520 [Casimicrobiaceae bacterium]